MSWIDITMGTSETMAVWPGNDQPTLRFTASYAEGADSITSNLTTNVHNGTHCDAPLHFVEGGATAETIDLARLRGEALVIDVGDAGVVDVDVLHGLVGRPCTRLLIKSDNSRPPRNRRRRFDTSYVALTADAAQWVVDHDIVLVGIDYLSIALYEGTPETHRTLMHNDVQILEGLVLDDVEPGRYELLALPMLIFGAEAAPTRALLRALP